MNIAISYHFNPNKKEWGTPQGIEFELKKNGHNVKRYLLDPINCNFSELIEESNKFDVIIFFYAGQSNSFDDQISKLKQNTKTKIFLELGDEPQTFHHNQKRIFYADAILTPDLRCHNIYKSKGLKSYWMPHWCDDTVFYLNKNIEVLNTCITTCGDRPPYTNILSKFLNDKFINKKIPVEENNAFYNSGIIVYQHARFDEITRRIFEGGGCKKAVITNRVSDGTGIYSIFKEDEDICYYNDEMDLIKKMSKLFNDEKYRNKLADNIYNKITNNHLTKHRINFLIDVLNQTQ